MITKVNIERNEPVVLKWANVDVDPVTNETADGIVHGQADEFLTRIEGESQILKEMLYVEMDGPVQNIEHLRLDVRLQSLKQVTGPNKGAQVSNILDDLEETVPKFLRQELVAEPFIAYTKTPKTFLYNNIEKDEFLNKLEGRLAPGVASSADKIAMFADTNATPASGKEKDGMYATDGVLAQLKEIETGYDESKPRTPQGFLQGGIDTSKPLIPQIAKMLKQYGKQKGKRSKATIYVDGDMLSDLSDEKAERETAAGDKAAFDEYGNLKIRGRPVVELEALNEPENEFGRVVLICDFDSIGYGPIHEVEGMTTWNHERYSYVTSVQPSFGVVLIYPQDVLAARVVEDP